MVPLSWFGRTLWRFTPLYVELTFLAACIRLIGLVQPFVFQVIIDRILPFQREASLLVVVALMIGVSLFQSGFSILSGALSVSTANRVTRELGGRLFDHLFRLPLSHFRRWPVGETLARVGETDTIRAFLLGVATGVFLDLLFVAVYLVVLFSLSGELTLVVLAALPLQALIYAGFSPVLRLRLRAQFDAGSRHQAQMVENILGSTAVKALGAEGLMLSRLGGTLANALDTARRVATLNIASSELTLLCDRAVTIGIVYVGAQQVFAGDLTLGQLIAFQLVAEKVAGPVAGFSKLWQDWQNLKVSRQRLGDIVSAPAEPFGERPRLPPDLEPRLGFHAVGFSYVPGIPVLDRFSFAAEPYSCTLVVGPSGVGKSTFGRLASGIETPERGKVTLGGADIAEHDPHDVRTRIAYVPQEPYLFSGTLRANLLLGRDECDDEELRAALRVAAATDLATVLAAGLDTEVGERGAALSGGQRQRVAIARAVLLKPSVLVLDEPTSALDASAQNAMIGELMRLRRKMTVIVITHRPELFAGADQIVDFGAARPA